MITFFAFALLAGAGVLLPVAEMSTSDDIDETDTDVVDETDEPSDDTDTDEDTEGDDTSDDDTSSDDDALVDDELIDDGDVETPYADEPVIFKVADDVAYEDVDDYLYGSHSDDVIDITDARPQTPDGYFAGDLEVYLGDGNDELVGDAWQFTDLSLYGEAGDDTIAVDGAQENKVSAYGGTGNDTIYVEGADDADLVGYAYGGEGDDVLNGGKRTTIYGGDGNDVLDGDSIRPGLRDYYDDSRYAYGGDGDDILNINRVGGSTDQDGSWNRSEDYHYGGAGADTFNLQYSQVTTTAEIAEGNGVNYVLSLDFEAGVDVLVIEVRDVPSAVILEDGWLTFEYNYGDFTMQSIITLGDENVTADDIVLNFEDPAVSVEIQTA